MADKSEIREKIQELLNDHDAEAPNELVDELLDYLVHECDVYDDEPGLGDEEEEE